MQLVTEESDEINRLVAAVVAGDKAALNQLLVILRPLVVRYCRSRLGTERSGVAADDVAQEVCLAVLKSLPTYTDQGKPFLAFVYGIAAHKVVDAHRHAGRDRSEPTDDVPEGFTDAAGPEQHALEASASAEMRALLAQLPPKQRENPGAARGRRPLRRGDRAGRRLDARRGAGRPAPRRRQAARRAERARRPGAGRHPAARDLQYAGRSGKPERASGPSLTPSTWCSWMLFTSNPTWHAGM